ncbi:uncharacterized protein LAJ45_04156 [Morchella importuna]|uniref:uncharacterized protein n=1 Tax=Morchella importuna TaxID=1174673 RepID=UPI001E8D8947|nr:uncharacterized protein LAJ45_04156 [Morchella importuna]KAH8151535.1 hypothetical protein LAJ45_04156 [Morchella importuna]
MEGKGLGLSNSGLAYDESFKNLPPAAPQWRALSINERVLACVGYGLKTLNYPPYANSYNINTAATNQDPILK